MSERLGGAAPRGLAGALERFHRRRAQQVEASTVPRPRPEVEEPTGQYAIVVDRERVPYVRLGHRWFRAGDPTLEPTPWPDIKPVEILSRGER